jgi:hypothetical protein
MIVKDLDGNNHNWQLIGNSSHAKAVNKSALHLQARTLLKDLFPTLSILEEVSIPLRRSETLYLDFYIPMIKVCVETHGEQHYKFVGHYHHNMMGFMKHKKRDKEKIEWCQLNNITYIELPFNETPDNWSERIKNEYQGTS